MMAVKQVTEKEMQDVTETTAEILNKQDKVKVRLFLPPDQKKKLEAAQESGKEMVWPSHPVQINGYIYQIQLGKQVEVPQSVAEILEEAGLI